MGRWLGKRNQKIVPAENRFQTREPKETQSALVEQYLSQFVKEDHKPPKKKRKVVLIAIGICLALGLGTSLFFFLGGSNRLAATSSSGNSKEDYINMLANDASPLNSFMTMLLHGLTNLQETNTETTGTIGTDYKSTFEDIPTIRYQYDIDACHNNDIQTAKIRLTLNNNSVGTIDYYQNKQEKKDCIFFPAYPAASLDRGAYDSASNLLQLNDIITLMKFAGSYLSHLNDAITKNATITFHKDKEYTIDKIPTTADCYELTLTKAQTFSIVKQLLADIPKDKMLNASDSSLATRITYIATIASYYLSEIEFDENDKTPYVSLLVYYKDKQVIGRSLSILDSNKPTTVFFGSLETENETNYSFYIQDDSKSDYKDRILSLQLSITEFNNKYRGSFTYTNDTDKIQGSFSNVSLYGSDYLFPISGGFHVQIDTDAQDLGYPGYIDFTMIGVKNQFELLGSLSNISSTPSSNGTTSDDDSLMNINVNLSSDIHLKVKQQDKSTPSSVTVPTGPVLMNWEEFSNALQDQSIEEMLNRYSKAFGSTHSYTHSNALAMIKKGYLLPFFPDTHKLLSYYNESVTYYDPSAFDLSDSYHINPVGDYEDYGTMDTAGLKNYKKNFLKNGTPLHNTTTLSITVKDKLGELKKIMEDATGKSFDANAENATSHNIYTTGNIFTGKCTYTIDSNILLYAQDEQKQEDQSASISISFDEDSGKITTIFIELATLDLENEQFLNLAARVLHLADSKKSTAYYLKKLQHSFSNESTASCVISSTNFSATITSDNGFSEFNEPSHYYNISISSDASSYMDDNSALNQ